MQSYLNSILDKVPSNIRQAAPEFISRNVSLFEPKEYVTGQTVFIDHYHFVIFLDEPPVLKIGTKEYKFRKGSLMALKPGMELSVPPFKERIMSKYTVISVYEAFFQRILEEAVGKERVVFEKIENSCSSQLFSALSSFKHEMQTYGDKYSLMIDSFSIQIAFQLLRDTGPAAIVNEKKDYNENKYVKRAIEYMETCYHSNTTLESISREIYISTAHFGRIFKHHTGLTPHQYLMNIRIIKAKELLRNCDLSIEEAALSCGFDNVSHFSTAFKRMVGIKPSEYKKQNNRSKLF